MLSKKYQKIRFLEDTSVCYADCPMSKTCANHASANIERKSDGMTPEIFWSNDFNSWVCEKIDTKINYGQVKYNYKTDKMELVFNLNEI